MQNLIVRMAIAHAHFEAVHPFMDGNGRVGRLLIPLMMVVDNKVPLYLSSYIDAHKNAYYEALKEAQQRLRWDAMVGFFSDAVVGTVNELLATRAALKKLHEVWLTKRKFRQKSASIQALEILPHYPVLTVNRLATLLGVTFAQASKAIKQLVEVGIVTERTGYSRNRVFVAADVLAIINRPFGDIPIVPTDTEETGHDENNRFSL